MYKLILAAASLALAAPVAAQTVGQADQQSASQPTVSAATRQFVADAAMTDMFEVQAGLLALRMADDPAYLDFAQLMIADHDNASAQFKNAVSNLPGVQLPPELDGSHKAKIDELKSLSGAAFERQYKTEQVQDHHETIARLQKYAEDGDNPDLKTWAAETLPSLKAQLDHAEALPNPSPAPTSGSGLKSR